MVSDNLNDETTYKMVESNCDAKVMKGIAKIIGKYKDNFTNKENEYLISFPYNTSKLCDFPKICKSKSVLKMRSKNNKKSMYWLLA